MLLNNPPPKQDEIYLSFAGNNIASYYLPLLVANVGITDQATVLLLNGIYALTGWIAAGSGARLHDVVGRRKMLLGRYDTISVCVEFYSLKLTLLVLWEWQLA